MRRLLILLVPLLALTQFACNTTPIPVGAPPVIALIATKYNLNPEVLRGMITYWESLRDHYSGSPSDTPNVPLTTMLLAGGLNDVASHYKVPTPILAGILIEYYSLSNNPDLQ